MEKMQMVPAPDNCWVRFADGGEAKVVYIGSFADGGNVIFVPITASDLMDGGLFADDWYNYGEMFLKD